jgi:hypothetical protein
VALLKIIAIYLVTPLLGLAAYAILMQTMRRARVDSPPTVPFFILFFTFGGWLLVLLTAWLWEWSGMASIGMIYLLLIAPVLTGIVFWRLRSQRTLSGFHRCAFLLSGAYICFVIVAVPLWLTSPGVGR